ncbi:MAG: dihydropyrimidinase [Spirochaetota bacterium]
MYDVVIKNGTVVNSDTSFAADVAVRGGKIVAVGRNLDQNPDGGAASAARVVDAAGKLVIPGGVDSHVHLTLDLGGDTVSSDDFFTGTQAAAFGGTTTVVPFIHPEEGEGPRTSFERRQQEALGNVVVDYSWHMNIGPLAFEGEYRGREGLRRYVSESMALGIPSYKLYMAYGYQLSDVQLYAALEAVGAAGGLAVVHAENFDLISMLVQRAVEAGQRHPRWHEKTRPAEFEAEAASKVIAIARRLGVPMEIFHIGTDHVVDEIRRARRAGAAVYGETCPQYLFLNTDAFERPGVEAAYVVCAPPIRPEADRQAMWAAIAADDLQIVATDHCPFTHELKARGLGEGFSKIPGGVPSMEMRMAALYSGGVAAGHFSASRWVELCSTFPARLHGFDSKGVIAPGYDADIVLFDPRAEWTLRAADLHENCSWTPYEGLELTGKVDSTFVRGEAVVEKGVFVGRRGSGRFVERRRAGRV